MENKNEYVEFVSPENYKQQIEIWYRAYNISHEKIELFYDFLISLYDLIEDTYMGPDLLYLEEDQRNHFTWCWDKVIENFKKEKINFRERSNCYEYLWNFFLEAYYINKVNDSIIKIKDYFNKLFDLNYVKTRSELDIFTEVYKLFDLNLKK